MLLLNNCSQIPSFLLGGGPKVAANIQAGQTNTQTVGQTRINEPRIIRPKAKAITQDNSTTTNNELPIWVWITFIVTWIVGWVTDTPGTMIKDLFRRKK
jgi:hypothetical protein